MPGLVMTVAVPVLCAHGAPGQCPVPDPRVLVLGQPVVTVAVPYVVAGCPFVPPAGNGPCVTAQWIPPTAATRVFASGQPLLLQTSQAVCAPTGTPVTIVPQPTRVVAV